MEYGFYIRALVVIQALCCVQAPRLTLFDSLPLSRIYRPNICRRTINTGRICKKRLGTAICLSKSCGMVLGAEFHYYIPWSDVGTSTLSQTVPFPETILRVHLMVRIKMNLVLNRWRTNRTPTKGLPGPRQYISDYNSSAYGCYHPKKTPQQSYAKVRV